MEDQQQALAKAIRASDDKTVQTWLGQHPDWLDEPFLIYSRSFRFTPLAYAIQHKCNTLAKWLLEQGAAATSNTLAAECLPLYRSVAANNPEGMALLLTHGANFAAIEAFPEALKMLWTEVFEWKMAMLEPILAAGASVAAYEAVDDALLTVAIKADAHRGLNLNAKHVRTLVQHGAALNPINAHQMPPLFAALLHKRSDLFDILLELGADPNSRDSNGENLLFWVAKMSNVTSNLRQRLFSLGIDPNVRSKQHNFTVLHNLAQHHTLPQHKAALITELLKVGADIDARDDEENTPLLLTLKINRVVREHQAALVAELLKAGANANAQDVEGNTPLLLALKAGATDIVTRLIEAGADIQLGNQQGLTPMIYCGDKHLQKLLGKQNATVTDIVSPLNTVLPYLEPCEPWAVPLRADIQALSVDKQEIWGAFLELCLSTQSSRPTQTWRKKTRTWLTKLDFETTRDTVQRSMALIAQARTELPRLHLNAELDDNYPWKYIDDERGRWYLDEHSSLIIRGLLWLMAEFDDSDSASVLRNVATAVFKKIPGIGMRSGKIGNAALYALSQMSGDTGVRELAILHTQIKYNSVLKLINRVFEQVAKTRDVSVEELVESAVSDYGMQEIGKYRQQLGEFTAHLTLLRVTKTELTWFNQSTGKTQKSVPAAVKGDYEAEVKHLKALAKDLQKAAMAQRYALERLYLEPKTWSVAVWQARYIKHPLCAFLGRRLLWRFHPNQGEPQIGLWFQDAVRDVQRQVLDLNAFETVELWHPVHSDPSTIEAWRSFLLEHEIVQPFKQAHREIYLLTDAEHASHNHSQRFAGHIVRQDQVHALVKDRGWSQTLGGFWNEGSNTHAYRDMPHANLTAVYNLTVIMELGFSNQGSYTYCSGGAVAFYNQQNQLDLEMVPPLLFSEIMRDVDLFVAIASVGNDPEWEHRQDYGYWREYNDGELLPSAESRKQVLTALLPKLKIAKQTRIEGRYLFVTGKLRTYKIHLGSGNILMEPNNSYLCIVQTKDKTGLLYLPFEGDNKLSLILSKAFLLAADDKITDSTILSQIKCF